MKILLFLCSFFIFFSCKKESLIKTGPSFLIGNWVRVNDKDSIITYENWQENLSGVGLSLKNKDTVFFEKMSIINKNDSLFLKVEGVNEKPTLFKFTEQTDTSFVCINSKNEFPKEIKYYLDNKQLKAIVSADDFKIDFIFDKQ